MGSGQSKGGVSSAPADGESCPVRSKPKKTADACPVRGKEAPRYKNKEQYNVYNQKIDPTNQMPSEANQVRSPDSAWTAHGASKIDNPERRDGTGDVAVPISADVLNALVRKNKTEGASEKDIVDVVAVHNNMNEKTWKQVLIWEDLVENKFEPTLLRFLGRPDELSPRARLKMLFGHPEPFDRHDWYVDRGGEEVRYIIDYYHDESNTGNDKRPKNMHDATSPKASRLKCALLWIPSILDAPICEDAFAMLTSDPRVNTLTQALFCTQKDAERRNEERRGYCTAMEGYQDQVPASKMPWPTARGRRMRCRLG